MLKNEEQWLDVVDGFQAAALGALSWETALKGLARATGSRSTQLTGVSSKPSVLFNVLTDLDPSLNDEFSRTLSYNPRASAVSRARVLEVFADSDIVTPDEFRSNPFYREVALPCDIPYICATGLEKSEDGFLALAVIRSWREGHITVSQREIFSKLASHVRTAIQMELALNRQGAELLAGTMEALSIAAFVCDRRGRVRLSTPAGERLISTQPNLRLINGYLGAIRSADAKALDRAIAATSSLREKVGPSVLRTVVIGGSPVGTPPVVLDIFPLPSYRSLELWRFDPQVLVVARGPRGTDLQKTAVLKAAYGLTSAECEIALQLASGLSVDAIAATRGATVGTVRQQVKSILLKTGTSRQIELAGLLSRL